MKEAKEIQREEALKQAGREVEVDEKLKKRKERFGILTAAAAVGAEDSEAKKRKRAERFGNN
uniref:THO1-MOS11 C-terminal domain-containing protein n=1 Tax=Hucho hucho TaxID=62062 RepID=A0A4W5MSI1_9TELE